MNTANASGAHSVRIAKDPRNNQLYYLKINGDIFQVNLQPGGASTSTKAYGAADHGLATSVEGMAIGPDGTIYLVANTTTNNGNANCAQVSKGVPNTAGGCTWSVLAKTEAYQLSKTAFDHLYNGIVVSPDGQYVYINCGSRTDHGEVETAGGLYPDLREAPLTAKILRLPANGSNLVLTNDINRLRQAGYVFAEGTRNSFDLAIAANGDLFATENGPDRDMSDELNWIRQGMHYGFPWRMGGLDNPQRFAGYDPTADKLLDPRFIAVVGGAYHNDPTFPVPPTNNFGEPVINLGPDADSFRNPADGSIKDASSLGQTVSTFTPHRSPLGLVFDTIGAMATPFQNHAFMVSWTQGDPAGTNVAGPFDDPSQDMVDLNLTKLGNTNYQTTVTRIVGGFSNPIDSEIISNRIYIIEYGGNQGIWEVTFPAAPPAITLGAPLTRPDGSFQFGLSGPAGLTYEIDASTNFADWLFLTNLVPNTNQFQFIDYGASNFSRRFYRAVKH